VELAVAKYEEELRASGLHVESHQLKIYGKCQHCLQKEHANLRSSLSV
jgi:Fe2+ or Zn2+ uptake regulation protein